MPKTKRHHHHVNDAYSEYQEQLDAIGEHSNDSSDDENARPSLGLPATDLDDLGEDVDPLLGPGNDETVNRMNRAMVRQQKHFNFQCRPQAFICIGIISLLDIIMLVVEFIYGGGWIPGSWWGNIDGAAIIKLGAKDTALIQKGQFWRLFTAMFLHVGLLHCVLNILTQLSLSVQIESSLGPLRTAFIYLVSGVGGNIASAIFLPNLPEVGASSSIFGLVAVYFVDLIVNWSLHANRTRNLIVLGVTTLISFAMGFFPHIDNFAHLGGFITGLIAAFIVMPDVSLPSFVPSRSRRQYRRKLLRIIVASVLLIALFIAGFVVLYSGLNLDHWCGFCEYISCLPIFQSCKALRSDPNQTPY
jgi:membrane associated rhomboid family serine protease